MGTIPINSKIWFAQGWFAFNEATELILDEVSRLTASLESLLGRELVEFCATDPCNTRVLACLLTGPSGVIVQNKGQLYSLHSKKFIFSPNEERRSNV